MHLRHKIAIAFAAVGADARAATAGDVAICARVMIVFNTGNYTYRMI
jgi:hypothetical protein